LIRNLLFRRGTMMDEVYQKLIERTRVPPALKQVKTICFATRPAPAKAAVIKPLLAGVVRPRGRPPKVVAPLDQHYVALRDQLQRTFQTIGPAAA
jgi:hypothetical protein